MHVGILAYYNTPITINNRALWLTNPNPKKQHTKYTIPSYRKIPRFIYFPKIQENMSGCNISTGDTSCIYNKGLDKLTNLKMACLWNQI